jgi:hypothetical protein
MVFLIAELNQCPMKRSFFTTFILVATLSLFAQEKALKSSVLTGLSFRSVGPALTSGRIADFAVVPENPSTYYVASASGGVWKTVNTGTTYEPIFDSQGSYSIACVTLNPTNSNEVWVGTGENNNQRSVA